MYSAISVLCCGVLQSNYLYQYVEEVNAGAVGSTIFSSLALFIWHTGYQCVSNMAFNFWPWELWWCAAKHNQWVCKL